MRLYFRSCVLFSLVQGSVGVHQKEKSLALDNPKNEAIDKDKQAKKTEKTEKKGKMNESQQISTQARC